MTTDTRCPRCAAPLPAAAAACPRCQPARPAESATQSLPADPPAEPSSHSSAGSSAGSTRAADSTGSQPYTPAPPVDPDLPPKFGRFEVKEFVGEGSFAEVYRGYDPQLAREVALKVARPGTLGTPRRVRRFVREAQAAGNLRHPNIVPLYEIGEDAGKHFLVTAFIRGQTLAALIAAARPAGGLPPAEAARLTRRLAAAVAYAHGEKIVHRDIKPENVMVDGKGEPHILDFGLAARTEEGDEKLTQLGTRVGTPAYMAPEQARADADAVGPPADQYALGCTLYELLTGRTPFAGPPEVQLLLHQTQPPPSPRKHRPEVPKDLAAICLKCLEKAPADRYKSALELVADLDRYLRGEPVQARRQTLRYLAGKFVRRYRRPLAVTAGVLALLAAVTAAAFARVNAERDRAVAESVRAEESSRAAARSSEQAAASAREAEAAFQEARQAVDDFLTELSQEGLKNVPGLQPARLKFAQKAVEKYDRFVAVRPADPATLLGQARVLTALGSVKGSIGSADEAEAALKQAIATGERLAKDAPADPERLLPLARAQFELGYLYWTLGKNDQGMPPIRACIQRIESVPAAAGEFQARLLLAQAYNSLGNTVRETDGKPKQYYERARAIGQLLLDERPNDPDALLVLSPPIGNLAMVARTAGDLTESLRLENLFLELVDRALAQRPNSPGLVLNRSIGLDSKARVLIAMGRKEEAAECTREALAVARRVAADNPHVGRYQWILADALKNLADRLGARSPETKPLLEQAVRTLESLAGQTDDRVIYRAALVDAWVNLADTLEHWSDGKISPAERTGQRQQALEQAVREGQRLLTKFPNDPAALTKASHALYKRGLFDALAGRHQDGLAYLARAVDGYQAQLAAAKLRPAPDKAEELLEWCDKAQESAVALKRPADEIRFGRIAAEYCDTVTSPTALENVTRTLNRAGEALEQAGRRAEAVDLYTRGVKAGRPVLDKNPWHFYLRNGVTGGYRKLALAARQAKDVRTELWASREYMKTWLGPYHGVKIDEYVRPGALDTEAEAARVRPVVDADRSMKRFTVPCDFNGVKYPLHIYVTNYVEPNDIVADQARWLSDIRGGLFPAEVSESFKRLHRIAKENNVSFVDLCVYALGTVTDDKAATPAVRVAAGTFKADQVLWKEPAAEVQPNLAAVTDLKARLDGGPYNPALAAELVRAYLKLGEEYAARGLHADAAASLAEAVRWAEARPAGDPAADRQALAALNLALGKACDGAREYERAELALRRHLALLEADGPPADPAAQALADEAVALLSGVARKRGHLAEAARVCVTAVARGSKPAAAALAEVLKANPAVASALPADLRAAVAASESRAKRDGKPAGSYLADDITAHHAARLAAETRAANAKADALAAQYHEIGQGYKAMGKPAEYRRALIGEYQIRTGRPGGQRDTAVQALAAELAVSYAAADEMEAAVLWADRGLGSVPADVLLRLADAVEKGIKTRADPKKAERYLYIGLFSRGGQLFRNDKYADALPDLARLCTLSRADADDFNRLGMCHGKLGRWTDALAAYRRAYELDPADRGVAQNLAEALVIGGRPDEVGPFLDKLDTKGWEPRDTAVLAGLRAIAVRLTTRSPAETRAEREVLRRMSDPAFKITGWDWTDLDTWFAAADLPADKRQAVGRTLAELKGTAPERTTPLYPLAVGAKWVYAERRPDRPGATFPDVTLTVTGTQTVNGVRCYTLTPTGGDPLPVEHLVVRYDGLYRVPAVGKPHRLLALPLEDGETWRTADTRSATTRIDRLTVPAGKYTDVWLVMDLKATGNDGPVRQTWYAAGVGPVKIITDINDAAKAGRVWELKQYTPPPAK